MKKGFVLLFVFLLSAGCEESQTAKKRPNLEQLQQENKQLQSQLSQCNNQAQSLKQQSENLALIRNKVKPEQIYNLKKISISRFTGLNDKDGDGKIDELIVYFQPIDDCEDVIKAGGSVEVQLWNLNNPAGAKPGAAQKESAALIGRWSKDFNELKKLWYTGLMGSNYRLIFDMKGKIEKFDQPLTLTVTFTDYLSGKTFSEQKVIKP